MTLRCTRRGYLPRPSSPPGRPTCPGPPRGDSLHLTTNKYVSYGTSQHPTLILRTELRPEYCNPRGLGPFVRESRRVRPRPPPHRPSHSTPGLPLVNEYRETSAHPPESDFKEKWGWEKGDSGGLPEVTHTPRPGVVPPSQLGKGAPVMSSPPCEERSADGDSGRKRASTHCFRGGK